MESCLDLLSILDAAVEDAREQYKVIKQWQGTFLHYSMATDRLLGLLAHTMGDVERATAHFEDALAFCRQGLPTRAGLDLLRLR